VGTARMIAVSWSPGEVDPRGGGGKNAPPRTGTTHTAAESEDRKSPSFIEGARQLGLSRSSPTRRKSFWSI